MRLFYLLSTIFILQSNFIYSQDRLLSFKIEGTINADTGTIHLNLLFDTDYYPQSVKEMVAKVENNKFSFSGHIPYPQGFTLSYENIYISRLFVIEPGMQSIICNIDSTREIPKVRNMAMKEYELEYTNAFKSIGVKRKLFKLKRDSLEAVYQNKIPDSIKFNLAKELKGYYVEGDSVLLKYVTTHPNSYISFWRFVYLFSGFGYQSIFNSIYQAFSDSLRSTYAGEVLAKKLKIAGILNYGNEFPPILAVDFQNKELNHTFFLKNEYTLVDFWYSRCAPCIDQFPDLKNIYKKYQDKGFEIVGISIDKLKDKENWQNSIQKYQLVWPQYWDKDGAAAFKLSINKFPTNFLLDSQGKIIKKDLRPIELDQFLLKNME